MIYYDKIDVSEGTYVDKASVSKKCMIFHYWYFLDKLLKFQSDIYNGYHDVLMMY